MVQRCRLINLTVVSVLVLSLLNLLLTSRLLNNENCESKSRIEISDRVNMIALSDQEKNSDNQQQRIFLGQGKFSQGENPIVVNQQDLINELKKAPCDSNVKHAESPDQEYRNIFENFDINLGRWDNRLLFKMYDNMVVGEKYVLLMSNLSVCLATQSSLERLHTLVEVSEVWTGAISAAVFAAGEKELNILLLYIVYLRQCFVNIKNRVTFHLAMPKNHLARQVRVNLEELANMDCSRPNVTLQTLWRRSPNLSQKFKAKNPYPQNHLRNLARKNCNSGFVFLTDVDIIPSKDFANKLDKFLRTSSCTKTCAYVVPTYELDTRVRFPANKSELVRLSTKGLARPFHNKVFIYNQYATNFSRWESFTSTESQEVHISHPVTNFEFLYEPFYVSPDNTPPHDERFMGYGYTRNTQVYEMFVAGYEFQVLSPIFTVHWGLQIKRSRPPWREQQNNQNRKQFDAFKREVFARYNKDPLHMMPGQSN